MQGRGEIIETTGRPDSSYDWELHRSEIKINKCCKYAYTSEWILENRESSLYIQRGALQIPTRPAGVGSSFSR